MTPSITSRNKRRKKILKFVIPLAFWLGVWQFASVAIGKELLLPEPGTVGRALLTLGATPLFWGSALATLGRIFAGLLGGVLLGTLVAILTSAFVWADWLLTPAVKIIRATPVASFILLVILWAPTGQVPALVAALMVLPVLWGNVTKGIAQTSPLLLEAAHAYRFGRIKTTRLVYLPSVRPYFVSGCSTALGLAWKAGVAAEVLCVPKQAIGTQVYFSKIYLETPNLFAWTLVVIALSFLLESVLGTVFQLWSKAEGQTGG